MLLSTDKVSMVYRQALERVEVLDQVDFNLGERESVAIVGQSGSGKSTLLTLLAGLDRPTSGTVKLAGRDLGQLEERELVDFRARHLGIVFQQFHLMNHLTALENVTLPLEILHRARAERGQGEAAARAILEKVGLGHRMDHFPAQMSGGEKQRVAIARALVTDAPVILADEPSGNLDARTGAQVMDLLFSLMKERNSSLVLVTHNEELADRCDRKLVLRDGKLHA